MAHRTTPARDLALIAVFAGLTAALGLIPAFYTPLSPSPITAQTFGPVLAGALLGGRRGGLSQVLFLALVAVGLPLLSGGRGGIGVFAGVTVGFLVSWPVAAWLIGHLTYRLGAPYRLGWGILINVLVGMVVMYVLGIPGQMAFGHLSLPAAVVANLPYLPGDILKGVLAALVAKGVHQAYPGLLPWRGRTPEKAAA